MRQDSFFTHVCAFRRVSDIQTMPRERDDAVDSNTVTISSNSDALSNITYIDNSLVVSAGQAHDSLQQPTKDGNVWTITLNADRSGTSDVAQSFNTKAGGASHEWASSHGSWGDSPGGLNFYFGVNLTIRGETIAAYIGQGNWGASQHNWWFGGSALTLVSFVVQVNNGHPALGFRPQITIDGTQVVLEGTGNSSFHLAI